MRYRSPVNTFRPLVITAAIAAVLAMSIVWASEVSDLKASTHVEPIRLSAAARQELNDLEWWKKTILYHINVRSFKDSNGDGHGDLRGIIEKLDYLKMIGVETLLMSPFYQSPQKDGGYDISDHVEIDELYGNMADFEDLVQEVHDRGMKIVVEYVPNHSSIKHRWFQFSERALAEPEKYGKYKDYYVWSNSTRYQDPKHGGLPNNWVSRFGDEPAWRWSPIREEFYLHQFHYEQPDFNWREPKVREEIKEIARFWLRKGVDGLRIDAVAHVYEDIEMRDEPENPDFDPENPAFDPLLRDPYYRLLHVFTTDLAENLSVMKELRMLADEPEFGGNRILIAEIYLPISSSMMYYGPSQGDKYSEMPFNFKLLDLFYPTLQPRILEQTIASWLTATDEIGWKKEKGARVPWTCWVSGNHDRMRLAERFGRQNLDAFIWMVLMLPGSPVIYYGDELALSATKIDEIPQSTLDEGETGEAVNRIALRSPMPWDDSLLHGGFSNATTPWLPMNDDFQAYSVKRQLERAGKTNLKNFIRATNFRKEYLHTLMFGEYTFYQNQPEPSRVFAMARVSATSHSLLLLINFDDHYRSRVNLKPTQLDGVRPFDVPKRGKVLMVNKDGGMLEEAQTVDIHEIELERNQAVVLLIDSRLGSTVEMRGDIRKWESKIPSPLSDIN